MLKVGINFLKRRTTHVAFRNAVVKILAVAAVCAPILPHMMVRGVDHGGGV
jgi:hypothetical protein